MKRKVRICIVGGGSVNWSPTIIRDIMLADGLGELDFRLLDIDPVAARRIARLGRKMVSQWNRPATFLATDNQELAIKGADFVIITISTGGLATMAHDLQIPEKFGIFQTVGDTVGPGGWSRAMRNIPVFVDLIQKIRRHAPRAFVINYTNPMTTLTKTICLHTDQPVVGLCHGLFEVYSALQTFFGIKNEKDIRVNIAGINHFFWMLDMRIRGRDGYAMLRRRLRGRKLNAANMDDDLSDVFHSRRQVAAELYERYGYLPYLGDRHTCEFFSRYLTPNRSRPRQYGLVRTSIAKRRQLRAAALKRVLLWIDRPEEIAAQRSRETAADIIVAGSLGRELVDVVNLPNQGQISNLPAGAVVETMGLVDSMGFRPLVAGPLPDGILELVLPHVLNQEMIVQAALQGDWDRALKALANDPACAHLSWMQIEKMGTLLLRANRRYLPQFF